MRLAFDNRMYPFVENKWTYFGWYYNLHISPDIVRTYTDITSERVDINNSITRRVE